jgi:hypothetical protein
MSGWIRYRGLVGELPEGAHRRAAERLERRLDAMGSAPRRRGVAVAIASAIAAMLVVVWLSWPAATVDRDRGALALTTRAVAEEVELPGDGRMWIDPHSRVELTIEGGGATVELLEGSVALAVHAGPDVRWIVRADGHSVEAVGTRFRVRRTGVAPEVTVDEGTVIVRGPSLPREGVSVRAEEAVARASPAAAPPILERAVAAPSAPTEARASKESGARGRSPTERRAAASTASDEPAESAEVAEPAWLVAFRADIERGDLRAASTRVPSSFPEGFTARADLFLDAGDAFTAVGDAERADASYRAACRARPRATACGVATFRRALARARADDLMDAVALADDYLEHDPDGALAREAVGRRMEWNQALGRGAAARRDATRYVERWPEGARVETARRILAE